jgi:hypothetical protein
MIVKFSYKYLTGLIQFDAGSAGSNKTSSATNSKKAASLMASVLIPTCALFYVF